MYSSYFSEILTKIVRIVPLFAYIHVVQCLYIKSGSTFRFNSKKILKPHIFREFFIFFSYFQKDIEDDRHRKLLRQIFTRTEM